MLERRFGIKRWMADLQCEKRRTVWDKVKEELVCLSRTKKELGMKGLINLYRSLLNRHASLFYLGVTNL